ncbi:MAG: hypothetical protein K9H49_17775 [Bacteroidales bacterium]|nr:hypothetical protein [Bacteroidales bacterium]MCF8391464.1 hypothetical protein [Bacteroidales bacterium]
MKSNNEIFSELNGRPFSLGRFFREHQIGILGTLAFHMILLIIFLLVKIQSFQKVMDLDLVMEFIEIPVEEFLEKEPESREEFLERLIEQQLRASNRAVNEAKLEEEISTEKYVEDFLKKLEEERSEEWKKANEEMEKLLNQQDVVKENEPQPDEKVVPEFSGPTNISYEFLSEPFNRVSVNLPIPVYKCRGYGKVEVLVEVNRLGNVVSAKANVIDASEDSPCFSEIAEEFALKSVFRGDNSAPADHRAKITYIFISQD